MTTLDKKACEDLVLGLGWMGGGRDSAIATLGKKVLGFGWISSSGHARLKLRLRLRLRLRVRVGGGRVRLRFRVGLRMSMSIGVEARVRGSG